MIWLNPWLLTGLAAIVLPLVIHLAMRRRPLSIEFPAVHLVRQSSVAGGGRTRLRHLLLMALRMLIIAALVIMLARPVQPDSSAFAGDGGGGTRAAIVLCFDNSPSMGYNAGDRSSLQQAVDQAESIIKRLPAGSRAAIIDLQSAGLVRQLQSDLSAVRHDLRELKVEATSRPIDRLIRSAAALLREAPEVRREIYLFSDLQPAAIDGLAPGVFADLGGIALCIIDLAPLEGLNVALGLPRFSSPLVSRGSRVAVSVDVINGERQAGRTVLLERDGRIRDRRIVKLDAPFARSRLDFLESAERLGPLQGRLLIDEADALEADNVRFFTLQAAEPPSVLVVGGRSTAPGRLSAAQLVAKALSPDDFAARPPVAVKMVALERLSAEQLSPYETVILCDPDDLPATLVSQLDEYLGDGGHLICIAGPHMSRWAERYRNSSPRSGGAADEATDAVTRLFGAEIAAAHLWSAGSRFTVNNWQAAALAPFDGGRKGDLSMPIIYRALDLRPSPRTAVIMTVADGRPALIESTRGAGRVHLFAAGLDADWSNLPAQPYEFVPLMHGLVSAGRSRGSSDEAIGEALSYLFPRHLAGLEAELTGPGLDVPLRRTIDRRTARAQFPPLREAGNYQIQVMRQDERQLFGFSLNIDPAESRFEPADHEALKAAFSPAAVSVSRSVEDVQLSLSQPAETRQLAHWILPLLMTAMVAELLLANHFYRQRPK